MAGRLSLGIDIGGTFTDVVVFDPASGRASIWKESTTPRDPAAGALSGVQRLLAHAGIAANEIGRVVHATTLFTNALIERKGARTGLITTEGFRDVLEIGWERKYELYNIGIEMPAPLVPRTWRREVAERLAPDGTVEIPLDVPNLLRETESLVASGVESLAVVFLHACTEARHERDAKAAIQRRFPDLAISLSSEIAPEIGEYPRASTTVANAYVRRLAESYLDRLAGALDAIGIAGKILLMLSSGGLADLEEAKRRPVQLLESGPAAGALAAAWFGKAAGLDRVLAFDMGGTTAKLALVDDGEPLLAAGFEAARERRFLSGSGLPIRIPTIELIEIGAGGGSIAGRSQLGTLQVGPRSAGAEPGPACYGRGGSKATVTDADLLLGALDEKFFLGGTMTIDREAAEGAVDHLAREIGVEPARAAVGIHEVVNESMVGAARVAIAERGRVPHQYTLLATGGAAPVHAWQIARKLGLGRILCPPAAGVGSTIGMLMAPARVDRVAAFPARLATADWHALELLFQRLEAEARDVLAATGADPERARTERLADMRYVGQGSEITVRFPDRPDEDAVRRAFESRYRALYARTPPGAVIGLVALRILLVAPVPGAGKFIAARVGDGRAAAKGKRAVWFGEAGRMLETPVFDRYALAPGTAIDGPAVFEENESTLIIGPGGTASVLADGAIDIAVPVAAVGR